MLLLYQALMKGDDAMMRALARQALTRYAEHRDTVRLEADMARLDAEVERLRSMQEWMPDWRAVLGRMRNLPALWEHATPPERRALAIETFDAIDAHGGRGMTVNFRSGVQAVVSVGSSPLAPTITITRTPWLLTEETA